MLRRFSAEASRVFHRMVVNASQTLSEPSPKADADCKATVEFTTLRNGL